jgi:hypothetical protein
MSEQMRRRKGVCREYGSRASAQRIALDLLRLDRRVFPRFKVDEERRRVFAELYEEGGAEVT